MSETTASAPVARTYCISTWDHEPYWHCLDGDWRAAATGLTRWQLRGWIAELRARGYDDDISILVEAEAP